MRRKASEKFSGFAVQNVQRTNTIARKVVRSFFRNSSELLDNFITSPGRDQNWRKKSKIRECLESNFNSRVSAHVLCLPTGQKFSKETSMNGHHSNANLHSVRAVFYDLKRPRALGVSKQTFCAAKCVLIARMVVHDVNSYVLVSEIAGA